VLPIVALALTVAPPSSHAKVQPYGYHDAGGFLNVLPAGEAGNDTATQLAQYELTGKPPPHFDDQAPLYQKLLYADPTLTDAQVPHYFKDATFGVKPSDVISTETPEPGLKILRDKYDVPHIYGTTRAEVMFGAGYAVAEDRLFLMDVLRHVGRAELSSFVGGSPSNRAMDEAQWSVAPYTERDLQSQLDAARQEYGAAGGQVVSDVHSYVDGINAYIHKLELDPSLMPSEYAAIGKTPQPWKPTDLIAEASLIGATFGQGGGGELQSALALEKLQQRFGKARGKHAWEDFREANDPEAPTTILGKPFPYETANPFSGTGLALPDPGSVSYPPIGHVTGAGAPGKSQAGSGRLSNLGSELMRALSDPVHASNWELVSAAHSATGHPLAVMGPQVGYYVPEILMEEDLHGPSIDARGAAFPGVSLYVELGHGRDYAWSATTSTSDNIDTFAEVLCRDAYHYLYRGRCVSMQKLVRKNSWTPNADDHTPPGSETLTAYRTVHGIVYARGKVHGGPVAFVHARSTYFHEADSALGFARLNDPYDITGPQSFQRAVSKINFLFNWSYVDASHISYYMSGWLPQRAQGTSPDFPILGTGQYDWKGYKPASHTADWLPFASHPHVTDQPYLVSWNNKQAPGWSAADNQWGYGPVFRSQLIADRIKAGTSGSRKMTIAKLVQSMEEPASEDLRAVALVPLLLKAAGRPHNAKLVHALAELRQWHDAQGHRRDLARSGHDQFTPAIEIIDAWWPKLVQAEFQPMLGSRAMKAIEALNPVGGISDGFTEGWYGNISKDLRKVYAVGTERGPYSQTYCGNLPGHRFSRQALLSRCRAQLQRSLAAALKVTPGQLYGSVCPKDPQPACADEDRYTDVSAIDLPPFPFQNRPTFQQVVTLTRHLPH
jgi:acyl-homoserine lactone acylase PvdQ